MIEQFKAHIDQNFPDLEDKHLGIAISGGLDSTVLAHLMRSTGHQISLIHVNFNLRGKESDGDQRFLEVLAKNWNIKILIKSADTKVFAAQNKMSTQMAARKIRYDYFQNLVDQKSVDVVLTAHHLDDQLETFLINLGRGTGLKGLTGIPKRNGSIIRPLLPFTRDQILDYATENQIEWREDSSNSFNDYTRNGLRNKVIPELKKQLLFLMNNFKDSLDYLEDAQSVVELEVSRFRESGTNKKCTTKKKSDSILTIDIQKLKNTIKPQFYLFELLRETQIDSKEAYKLLNSESGKLIQSDTHVLLKDRNEMILKHRSETKKVAIQIDDFIPSLKIIDRQLNMAYFDVIDWKATIAKHGSKNALLLDADSVEFPMNIRNWQEGDKMNPLGMRGSQKISDVLINHKIPLIDKENFLVLENKGNILWLIGLKASKHHKITSTTTRMLKIWLD